MDETVKTKSIRINAPRTAPQLPRKGPTQGDPNVHQNERQAQAEEPQGRIHRVGFDTHLSSLSIGTFNPKTTTIARFAELRRPIQLDQPEHQPFAASAAISPARQGRDQSHISSGPISERVGGSIAFASCTQGPCATRFAANSTRQYGRQTLTICISSPKVMVGIIFRAPLRSTSRQRIVINEQ